MPTFNELLERSAARHHNLCPRQVLGVRMGLLAGKILGVDVPQADKRLFAFVECDGCGMGGIAVATGCFVERRTMQVLDYGKLAVTLADTHTGASVRVSPAPHCRTLAEQAFPNAPSARDSQLEGYQVLPDEALLRVQEVTLTVSLEDLISKPNLRVNCAECGEEITNDRQVLQAGRPLCRLCAGQSYFQPHPQPDSVRHNGGADIPVITVIGRSGSGKTTLLEKLIRELTRRGYRIAAVKHHSEKGFEVDVPGKDSWRFAQAGSRQVFIASPDRFAQYRQLAGELNIEEITSGITGVDLILVEGYKEANMPAIEVMRAANSQELVATREQRIAIISDIHWSLGVPAFHLDDIDAIAAWIEKNYLGRKS